MSSQRGNANRSRPQKHQNSHAFKNSIHDTSQRTKTVNQLNFGGLTCQRCKDILDWKVKYKKYKLPTQPRKCVRCEKRCIQSAYFTVCQSCARERAECQKCAQQRELTPAEAPSVANQSAGAAAAAAANLDSEMQQLRERDKRTFLRLLQAERFETAAQASAWIRHRLGESDDGSGDDGEYEEESEEDNQ
ncbi:hypothetical protein BOX15_Mlig018840g3 [Macrostomum lignano]|uniref:DUF2039 domain-containing protein n=2 Tax=Macrostomum lignano TaxID=282301 RepID=A0A1I8IQI8_9PLAT|nr:hypothetical protein BOX15_Mlig018840g3 [Macrostomum lignano]